MANVLVTTTCAHGCAFCFASRLVDVAGRHPITVGAFEKILEEVHGAGGEEIRLVGGEPTGHPEFGELLRAAAGRGLRLTVLSGGFASRRAEESVAAIPESQVTVVLNVNAAIKNLGIAEIGRFVDRLAPRVALACTIDEAPWDSAPVEELAGLANLHKPVRIRVGLAHPEVGASNRWLSPSRYVAAGRAVAEMARRLYSKGVRLEFDCGFVRCAFDDEAMAVLNAADACLRFECRPIVDLTPDDRALHCLALGRVFAQEADGPVAELRGRMSALRRGFDEVGLYRECLDCGWRASGECDGGCLVVRLRRFERLDPKMAGCGGVA